ncbi:MAG: hypothetical protein K2W99_03775 [Chthoniobacterales bacterium]|nr:hypothetical protein [Chthoniobacterales bacterium]
MMEPLSNKPLAGNNPLPPSSLKQAERVSRLQKIQGSLQQVEPSALKPLSATIESTVATHTVKEVTIPIRKRGEARQIEKEAAAEISDVYQKYNEVIKGLTGDPEGMMTLYFLQERDQKVEEIKEKALHNIKALAHPTTEPLARAGEELYPEDQKIEELLQNYKTKLTTIEQEESEAIEKIENDPKATFRLRRDSSFRMEVGELKPRIDRVRQEAVDKKNRLFLEATLECHPYQKDFFIEVLKGYDQKLTKKNKIFSTTRIEEIFLHVKESFQREKVVLQKISPQSTSQELVHAIEEVEKEDRIRLIVLQQLIRASTTHHLRTLTEMEENLHQLKLLHTNKPSHCTKATELLQQLDKMHTDYFVAEAISTDLAQSVAEEAVNQLEQEIEKLALRLKAAKQEKELLVSNESEATIDKSEKTKKVEETITFYQELQSHLKKAQQAYKQIALDCSVRVKDILEFKDQVAIFKKASLLVRQGSGGSPFNLQGTLSQQHAVSRENVLVRTPSTGVSTDLETTNFTLQRQVSERFQLERVTSIRQNSPLLEVIEEDNEEEIVNDQVFGLDFLEKLEEIPEEKDSYFFVGKRGEIRLVPPEQAKEEKGLEGLHLTRLAIFRDYGAEGLAGFDEQFQEKIRLENPITLGELIAFIDQENAKNQSAYYLSSARSLKELIVGEPDKKEDAKLINVESASFTFAPTHTMERRALDKNENKKELFKTLQEEIKIFFKNLPPPQLAKTLEHFAQQFESSEKQEGKPFTVGNMRSFLIKEIEQHQADLASVDITSMLFDHLSPHMETLYAGLLSASGLSTGLMIVFDVIKSILSRLGAFRYFRDMVNG